MGFGHRIYKNYDSRAKHYQMGCRSGLRDHGAEPRKLKSRSNSSASPCRTTTLSTPALSECGLLLWRHLPGVRLPTGDVHGSLCRPRRRSVRSPSRKRCCETRSKKIAPPRRYLHRPRCRDWVPVKKRTRRPLPHVSAVWKDGAAVGDVGERPANAERRKLSESMQSLLIYVLFLVAWFLILPRIPGISRFT